MSALGADELTWEPVQEVAALRLSASEGTATEETCRVVVEAPLIIDIADMASFTLMCTPCDARALAIGFAFTEGLISDLGDIAALEECADDPGVIRLRLARPSGVSAASRNLPVVSSCGLCGAGRTLEELLAGLPPVGESLRLSPAQLLAAAEEMRRRQCLFVVTGGTHAAGLLDAEGHLRALAEDLGRHNALDKAIGQCLLTGQPLAGGWAVLSGRVSLELVSKAARAGLELLAAVSAPSSLALEAAQAWNLTICGFVREDRATVYTHPWRIRQE